jgi:hypothetical protein
MALLTQIASVAEKVGGWSTFLLAWLGVLAFFGALLGVAQTREDGKRARTLDYLRRLYSQEFAPLNAQVMAFVRTGDTRRPRGPLGRDGRCGPRRRRPCRDRRRRRHVAA